MAVFKCKMCGASLDVSGKETVIKCEYCGTKQTLPHTNDDAIHNLFNRANNLRLKGEFDKAADIYEKIVQHDDSEAEAHWGLVLCKYGIEYVEDPETGRRIPTCHRTHYDALTTDPDYQAAIDYSDSYQQELYEAEARVIDKIQKDTLNIVKNEKPFDVFICYKETDENGKRTQDSVIANDIYHQLTQEGFKVFYSAITLEEKLGQEYEPYIFAALNSAKVMLVVGTKPAYFNAVWVKNEWARFMQLMKTDKSKLLIPCYRDMDAYELPEEFAHLQAQDMSKIGFMTDVVRGIKKVLSSEKPVIQKVETKVVEKKTVDASQFVEHLKTALENGYYDSANRYCDKILAIDPENAEAHIGKLLIYYKVRKIDEIANLTVNNLDNSIYFQNAVIFGGDEVAKKLKECADAVNKNIQEKNDKRTKTAISVFRYSIRPILLATLLTFVPLSYGHGISFLGTLCVLAIVLGIAIDAYISIKVLKIKPNKAVRIINYIGIPIILFLVYYISMLPNYIFKYYYGLFSHHFLYFIGILAWTSPFIVVAIVFFNKKRLYSILGMCGVAISAFIVIFLIYISPIKYTLLDDGTYEISGTRNATITELEIPAEYKDMPVTRIGDYAFGDCEKLTSVTIPDSVTSIGYCAFHYCFSLTNVNYLGDISSWCGISFGDNDANPLSYTDKFYIRGTLISDLVIPEGVTNIGSCAFYGYDGITSVTIPNSVTSIGDDAFFHCTGLTSVTIGNSVTNIGSCAFLGCTGLTSVTIGNSVTSIGLQAFQRCTGLTSVTIPDSVTSIRAWAFYCCTSLTSIKYRGTEAQWKAINKGLSWDYKTGSYTITYNYTGE